MTSGNVRLGHLDTPHVPCHRFAVIVYAVVDDSLRGHLLGDSLDVFIRREDAECFIEEVRSDDPELAKPLRIEDCELEAGGLN